MVSLANLTHGVRVQTNHLQQYLAKHSVSASCRRLVFGHLRRRGAARNVFRAYVELLLELPADILSELRLQVAQPILSGHPFFALLVSQHSPPVMLRTLAMDVIA